MCGQDNDTMVPKRPPVISGELVGATIVTLLRLLNTSLDFD